MSQHHPEIALLRQEIEILMAERQRLLQITGSAAALIASLNSQQLPLAAIEAADIVATMINTLPEETLQEALDAVHAEIEEATARPANVSPAQT